MTPLKEAVGVGAAPKKTRRSRQNGEEMPRFFLGKASASSGRPELGEEATDENQALIKAFQQTGVIYVIHTYRVEAEVQEGIPTLVKRPLLKQQA
jgi:hypothetical protein